MTSSQTSQIKTETLQKEYETILQQYQEAVKTYIATLENNTDSNANKYAFLKGRTWWGKAGGPEGAAETQEECENMCSQSGNCSGATFNPVKKYCWTRTGEGELSAGLDDDYAMILQQKASLIEMKHLNDQLLTLNEKIVGEMRNMAPEVQQLVQDRDLQQEKLKESRQSLLNQKAEMERQLQEYYSVDDTTLIVNQQNLFMRFWFLIAIFIVFVAVRMYLSG